MGSFSMNKVLGSIKKKPTFGSGECTLPGQLFSFSRCNSA